MPMSSPTNLFDPPGIEAAHKKWGANCGPCALAALTGKRLQDVKKHLQGFEKRGYMNPTQMYAAIKSMKLKARKTRDNEQGRSSWPASGLVFIYFRGSWDAAPVAAQYKHTHWVATILERIAPCKEHPQGGATRHIFDVNAGRWMPFNDWIADILPAMGKEQKATGWNARHGIEVMA